jgi:hypothetical protein
VWVAHFLASAPQLPAWTLRGFGGGFPSDGALFGMFVFGCAFMILLARVSVYPWPIHWYWSIRAPKVRGAPLDLMMGAGACMD